MLSTCAYHHARSVYTVVYMCAYTPWVSFLWNGEGMRRLKLCQLNTEHAVSNYRSLQNVDSVSACTMWTQQSADCVHIIHSLLTDTSASMKMGREAGEWNILENVFAAENVSDTCTDIGKCCSLEWCGISFMYQRVLVAGNWSLKLVVFLLALEGGHAESESSSMDGWQMDEKCRAGEICFCCF